MRYGARPPSPKEARAPFRETSRDALLRTMEQAGVHGFAAHVALHRLQDVRPRFLPGGSGLHVKFTVERVHLDRVVMLGAGSWCAGTSIHRSRSTHLHAPVGKRRPL